VADHPGLAWLRSSPEGRAWLTRLPRLADECAERWSLRLGAPFAYAFASLALPVEREDGSSAVLKIQFPDREGEHEADALARWAGDGAVLLFDHDPERRALLIERCEPGTSLAGVSEEAALDAAIGLFPRLWVPAGAPFRSLAEEAAWWVDTIATGWERFGRPFERRLRDAAIEALTALPRDQGPQVLLHQDLHADNVLAAEREPWLAIDPKPLIGEREFGIAALVRGDELGRGPDHVRRRLDRLTRGIGLDRDRATGWTVGQTLAWSFGDQGPDPRQVEQALWALDA
jgi:streptomycin 6-kinase